MEADASAEQPRPVDLSAIIHLDNSSLLQLVQDLEKDVGVGDDMFAIRKAIHELALYRLIILKQRLVQCKSPKDPRVALEAQKELLTRIVALTRTSGGHS